MKRIIAGALAISLLIGTSAAALADPYHSHGPDYYHGPVHVHVTYVHPGHHHRVVVTRTGWERAPRVDYRVYHLSAPRPGYEWRYVNGQFVEGAIIGGVVTAALIAATH